MIAPEQTPTDALQTPKQKRHFHTFDALRFFAYLKVFLQHLPILSFAAFNYVRAGGGIGVQFFFALSGFLITYIICEEKTQTGKLDLKNFFARRVLRIWPLFYLMIGVAFITPIILAHMHLPVSDVGYKPTWWMSLLFLENYKMIVTHSLPNVSPLAVMWSLCVEEHFYIIWGLLLFFTPPKHLLRVIVPCIILAPVFRLIFFHYDLGSSDILTNIDLFAFGALPAYFLACYPEKTERFINNIPHYLKLVYVTIVVFAVMQIAQAQHTDPMASERVNLWSASLFGLLFAGLIALTLPANSSIKIGDKNILSRMGLYTYGLYLYHTLVSVLCKRICDRYGISIEDPLNGGLFLVATFTLTLGCSMASYYVFEKPFLKLKRFFR